VNKLSRMVLVAAAATTIGVVAIRRATPAFSGRDQAVDQFVHVEGAACVGGADIDLDMNEVNKTISEAGADAGWVVEDILLVGSLDVAVKSLDGVVTANEPAAFWVHATKAAPKLMRLEQRTVGKINAFRRPRDLHRLLRRRRPSTDRSPRCN
jgi:hypothetical protein